MPDKNYLYRILPFETDGPFPHFFVSEFSKLPCCGGNPLHRHEFYEVHWLSKGSAIFTRDFKQYSLQGDTLVFIAPGQVHGWHATWQSHLKLIVLGFKPMLLTAHGGNPHILAELPYFDYAAMPSIKIPQPQQGLFEQLFSAILARYSEINPEHTGILSSYVNVILTEANYLYAQQNTSQIDTASNSLTQAFQVAVNTYFTERKRVHDYAEMLGVSVNHLVETIRVKTGKTPGKWQEERVLLEAKRLLAYTDQTVAEIARYLSFKSASQFGKWFKKMQAETPGDFRQRIRHTQP